MEPDEVVMHEPGRTPARVALFTALPRNLIDFDRPYISQSVPKRSLPESEENCGASNVTTKDYTARNVSNDLRNPVAEDVLILAFHEQYIRIPNDTYFSDTSRGWYLLTFLKFDIIRCNYMREQGFHLGNCEESSGTVAIHVWRWHMRNKKANKMKTRVSPCVSSVSERHVCLRRGAGLMLTCHVTFTTLPELREAETGEFIGIRIYFSICMDDIGRSSHKRTRRDGHAI